MAQRGWRVPPKKPRCPQVWGFGQKFRRQSRQTNSVPRPPHNLLEIQLDAEIATIDVSTFHTDVEIDRVPLHFTPTQQRCLTSRPEPRCGHHRAIPRRTRSPGCLQPGRCRSNVVDECVDPTRCPCLDVAIASGGIAILRATLDYLHMTVSVPCEVGQHMAHCPPLAATHSRRIEQLRRYLHGGVQALHEAGVCASDTTKIAV